MEVSYETVKSNLGNIGIEFDIPKIREYLISSKLLRRDGYYVEINFNEIEKVWPSMSEWDTYWTYQLILYAWYEEDEFCLSQILPRLEKIAEILKVAPGSLIKRYNFLPNTRSLTSSTNEETEKSKEEARQAKEHLAIFLSFFGA
jgi:hypothetical protein